MPIRHLNRVRVAQTIPLHSQQLVLNALSLRRSASHSDKRTQSRIIRNFLVKKERLMHSRADIIAHLSTLRHHQDSNKSTRPSNLLPVVPSSPCVPLHTRRSATLQAQLSFAVLPDPLIPPSQFPSPFTPANQVLHTPLHPPSEPHKGTPNKRRSSRIWQWSPILPSPSFNESCLPLGSPGTPVDITRRFSLLPPPSTKQVPRRLSYSKVYHGSPWMPDMSHNQALASPVMIRSSFWPASSPVATPRYQLDDLQFSPFRVVF
ncbi:hypothetical protein R3P38DRAFT_2999039 [Favolaschia claudopus]|uniref:Uncharacterized protein n=1 Tax=Favolaschia claudopus TaxID=2862362 RepID=A0AAW0APX7_9AGAR